MYTAPKSGTFEYWYSMTRAYTSGLTQEQANAIAKRCHDAEARGERSSVWHEMAQVIGKPETCNCRPCSDARGIAPGRFRAHVVA